MILCAQARPPAKWNEEGGGVAEERVLSLDVERPARESFAADPFGHFGLFTTFRLYARQRAWGIAHKEMIRFDLRLPVRLG